MAKSTMQAVVLRTYGGPENLKLEELPTPEPNAKQILIRVEAASVNFMDTMRRSNGGYARPTALPAILGSEIAGTVARIGEDVSDLQIGQPVFALIGGVGLGGYAQFALVERADIIPIPATLDYDVACTLGIAGLTAYLILKYVSRIEAGETVFVPGAAGGVGSFAISLARHFGAGLIFAGASTEERRSHAIKIGADHAIDYTRAEWPSQVRELTGGRGLDIILQMAGGPIFEQNLSALAPFGRLVIYGSANGQPSEFVADRLPFPNQSITGFYVGGWFTERPDISKLAFEDLAHLLQSDQIKLSPSQRFRLADTPQAHRVIEAHEAIGKLVLKPWS